MRYKLTRSERHQKRTKTKHRRVRPVWGLSPVEQMVRAVGIPPSLLVGPGGSYASAREQEKAFVFKMKRGVYP